MNHDERQQKKGSMRNVYALGAVSFLTDVSSEMTFSILPSFLVQVLGASKAELGLVEGVAEASSNILRMISGYISDWAGRRKPLVFVGYGLSTLAKPLFAAASNWTHVLVVRFTDRVGKAVRTAPRDSLLSESVPSEILGKAFGLHRTLDTSGAILGPLLAVLLLPMMSYTGLFLFSLVPGLLALLVLLFLVQEVATAKAGGTLLGNLKEAISPDYLRFLSVAALFSIGAFNFSFILVAASDVGVPEQFVPAVYLLINVFHALVGVPMGTLSDRIGREKVLAFGYGLLGLTNAILLLPAGGVLNALIAASLFGLYMGTVETLQRAIVPAYVEHGLRGTAYGIYYLTVGVFYLFANVLVGFLWDSFGASAAFTYSLTTSLAAALIMLTVIPVRRGAR